jgi:hypothetical protein
MTSVTATTYGRYAAHFHGYLLPWYSIAMHQLVAVHAGTPQAANTRYLHSSAHRCKQM